MCLIVLAWQTRADLPLVLLANRDEFRNRPWAPAHVWGDPPMRAGRDLQAGGTWLGLAADGRFAALTNVRRAGAPGGQRSRGEWVQRALASHSVAELEQQLRVESAQFGGFNLLFGSPEALYCWHSPELRLHRLQPGIHGLSNADLDTPWPKVSAAKASLEEVLARGGEPDESWWEVLGDTCVPPGPLPDTGVGPAWEHRLAAAVITGPDYGTLSRNRLLWFADGRVEFSERVLGMDGTAVA